MKNTIVLMSLLSAFSLSACAPSSDQVGNLFPRGNSPQVSDPGSQALIEGTWSTPCLPGVFSTSGRRQIVVKVTGEILEHTQYNFSDIDCKNRTTTETFKGSFFYSAPVGGTVGKLLVKIPLPSISPEAYSPRYFAFEKINAAIKLSDFAVDDVPVAQMPLTYILSKSESSTQGPSAPPSSSIQVLLAGEYKDATGVGCNHSVSTQEVAGVTTVLYIDFMHPCSHSVTFRCAKGICTESSNRYSIKILSATSYEMKSATTTYSFKKIY